MYLASVGQTPLKPSRSGGSLRPQNVTDSGKPERGPKQCQVGHANALAKGSILPSAIIHRPSSIQLPS